MRGNLCKRVCFLCSRAKRKILIETASELGCNKIALGHHRDDVIETFLMNIFFNSEISCMMPDQPLPIDQVGPEGVAPVEAGMDLAGGVPDASGPDGMQAGIETPIIE